VVHVASVIAWLDTSAEEQRRAREIIALFSQPESRDELGIGQIRDAFSNTLFPGTSVLQTRARYFLFVPWIYRDGLSRKRVGQSLKGWADIQERRLIEALRKAGATEGLIGRIAGASVKLLPSAIYWSGLVRHGILTRDVAPDQLNGVIGSQIIEVEAADELAVRASGEWNPTLPPAPKGFPNEIPGGFDLSHDEAVWLAEQIEKSAPHTLLAYLLTADSSPDANSYGPWDDTAARTAPSPVPGHLMHAQLFSLCMHGAALLYNLLVGERYEQQSLNAVPNPVAVYHDRLQGWAYECEAVRHQLEAWDRRDMWDLVALANRSVGPGTKAFVNTWLEAITTGDYAEISGNERLRVLVANRERYQKGTRSRLINDTLLRTWSGASGSRRLDFRWMQVRPIITDIRDGLDNHEGARLDARP
jgi:Family of unknown function (DUF6361)